MNVPNIQFFFNFKIIHYYSILHVIAQLLSFLFIIIHNLGLTFFFHSYTFKFLGRFDVLNEYAKAEDIFTSTKTLRKWVNQWLNEGTISNKISVERRLKHIKITTDDLIRLDRALEKRSSKRDLSARLAKIKGTKSKYYERTEKRKYE